MRLKRLGYKLYREVNDDTADVVIDSNGICLNNGYLSYTCRDRARIWFIGYPYETNLIVDRFDCNQIVEYNQCIDYDKLERVFELLDYKLDRIKNLDMSIYEPLIQTEICGSNIKVKDNQVYIDLINKTIPIGIMPPISQDEVYAYLNLIMTRIVAVIKEPAFVGVKRANN